MRQFIEDVEKGGEEESGISVLELKEESGTGVSELNVKEMCDVKDTGPERKCDVSGQQGHRTLNKDAIKALKRLFADFDF